jgi:hypothetical protein
MDSLSDTMKAANCLLALIALSAAGCGRASDPTATGDQATQRTAADTPRNAGSEQKEDGGEVAWNRSLLADGGMFQDIHHFGWYVRNAQIVATGVLSDWDGTQGNVQLESVLHGEINDSTVPVITTGGFVRPKRGDKVLFLLALRDGRLTLHSFCAASGLYHFSDDLALAITQALEQEK